MNEKTKQRLKKVGKVALYSAAAVGTLTAIAVVCYQPKEGKHSPRSLVRNDGIPKKAFNSRIRANLQCLLQLVKHGELCVPYKIKDKYYTGHNRELNNRIKQGITKTAEAAANAASSVCNTITEPRNVQVIAQTIMNKDTRTYFEVDEEEYDNMTEEEQAQIDENQLDVMDDIMFPDGHDENDDYE